MRLCREDDADGIAAMIAGMSPDARAMRFGAARGGLTAREAADMAAGPGPLGAGVVAVAGGEGERIVAVARYHRAEGAADAELAAAVADRWQGLGLGTALVERLCDHAAAHGIDAFWAWMRTDNRRMRSVLDGLGGPVTVERTATASSPASPCTTTRPATTSSARGTPRPRPRRCAP